MHTFWCVHFYQNVSYVFLDIFCISHVWDKTFSNKPSKICVRQPVKHLISSNFSKSVLHKFYLVHSLLLSPIFSFFGFSFTLAANSTSEWFCDEVTLRVTYKGKDYNLNSSCGSEIAKGKKIWPFSGPVEIVVPKRYSYACSSVTISFNGTFSLEISGMQVWFYLIRIEP